MKDNEEILNLKFRICDNVNYKIDDNGIVTVLEKQDHNIQKFFRKLRFKIPLYKEITFDIIIGIVVAITKIINNIITIILPAANPLPFLSDPIWAKFSIIIVNMWVPEQLVAFPNALTLYF